MLEVTGGLAISIAGVVFTGWKSAAIIGAGVTTSAGAVGIGVWNGDKDTQDQKNS